MDRALGRRRLVVRKSQDGGEGLRFWVAGADLMKLGSPHRFRTGKSSSEA